MYILFLRCMGTEEKKSRSLLGRKKRNRIDKKIKIGEKKEI